MSAKKPVDQQSPSRVPEQQRLCAVIGRNLIRMLGEPLFEHRVETRELWECHYRVNVLVGGELGSMRIVHSYFLATDGEGNILEATPRIRKQY